MATELRARHWMTPAALDDRLHHMHLPGVPYKPHVQVAARNPTESTNEFGMFGRPSGGFSEVFRAKPDPTRGSPAVGSPLARRLARAMPDGRQPPAVEPMTSIAPPIVRPPTLQDAHAEIARLTHLAEQLQEELRQLRA